jgi:hypothetical protein
LAARELEAQSAAATAVLDVSVAQKASVTVDGTGLTGIVIEAKFAVAQQFKCFIHFFKESPAFCWAFLFILTS